MAVEVKYLKGSAEQYEAYLKAGAIVPTNFYYIDGKDLYLGEIKLSNQKDIELAVSLIQGDYQEGELIPTLKDLDTEIKEIKELLTDLDIKPDEAHVTKKELEEVKLELEAQDKINAQEILDLKADVQVFDQKIDLFEQKINSFEDNTETIALLKTGYETLNSELTVVKSDIEELKVITQGIGGEGEPATILLAIQQNNEQISQSLDTLEQNMKTYVDDSLSWKEISM